MVVVNLGRRDRIFTNLLASVWNAPSHRQIVSVIILITRAGGDHRPFFASSDVLELLVLPQEGLLPKFSGRLPANKYAAITNTSSRLVYS